MKPAEIFCLAFVEYGVPGGERSLGLFKMYVEVTRRLLGPLTGIKKHQDQVSGVRRQAHPPFLAPMVLLGEVCAVPALPVRCTSARITITFSSPPSLPSLLVIFTKPRSNVAAL